MAPRRPLDSLRLFVGTWNMHGKAPPASLVPWLPASPDEHDMYVIGTQEAERSIEKSLIISSKAKWEAALRAHFGDGFVLLSAHTLAAIHIACFVSVRVLEQVGNVQSAAVATGVGNTLGNKGGVALGCTVGSTSLLFVNVHLSAHQHAVAQRNADYHRIAEQLPLQPAGRVPTRQRHEVNVSKRGFDALVWLGDFNYRVDANRAVVDALLAPADERARAAPTWRGEEAHWDESRAVLLANDQLRRQMSEGGAFAEYREGEIRFRPTYKFDSKVRTEYDHSEKQRIPAYTDRVLYRGEGVELLRYESCESLLTSDHRPVTAEFRLHYQPRAAPAPTDRAVPAKSGQTSSICAVM